MNLIGLRFNDASDRRNKLAYFIVRRHKGGGKYEVEWFDNQGKSDGIFEWRRRDILNTNDVMIHEADLAKIILNSYKCLD
jgi:hypothetical protein